MKKNVIVEEAQIKACFLKQGTEEVKANERAAELHKELINSVPAKFQEELDFYLKNLKPSESEVGQRIERLMRLPFNSFFDALVILAVGK